MRTLAIPGVPRLPKIGLGTRRFGARGWGDGEDHAEREARAIVQRALDLGMTLFDTSEGYGFGRGERLLGAALAGRRAEAYLATKLLPVAPFAPVVEQRARASARRLGVDHLDLYQVPARTPLVPPASTMAGLRRLLDAGVIGEVGGSNVPLAGWRAAERALGRRVLSDQVDYSLLARAPERDLLPHAAAAGRVVIASSPLAHGLLSGRDDPATARRGARERTAPLLRALREVAAGHGVSPAQVALAWAVRHPNVVAIPGAANVPQLEASAAAADLDLAADEVDALTAASDALPPARGPRLSRRRR